jgi:hypothetical protein
LLCFNFANFFVVVVVVEFFGLLRNHMSFLLIDS